MVRNNTRCTACLAIILFFVPAMLVRADNGSDPLAEGFRNPPDSAKPRVWWHWMNGNITKEGIKLDLEWMKRVGIGGFQNFDAALATPQVVSERLVYMTPKWKDAFGHAARLADQLGLEMAIAGSPGWSESGGPWVPPSQGMKKFVWSETRIEGGRAVSVVLPKPPSATGPFQNMRGDSVPRNAPQFYADSAVVAYRAPDSDVPLAELEPKITSSGGHFDIAALTDGDVQTSSRLPKAPVGEKAWIQFEFSRPVAICGFTLGLRQFERKKLRETGQQLEASDDGQNFRRIAVVAPEGAPVTTMAFNAVTAKFFRVTFRTLRPMGANPDIPDSKPPKSPANFEVSEVVLHTAPRVNRFEDKAGFGLVLDSYSLATPTISAGGTVEKTDVVDLTSKMQPDGTLHWTPAPGRWIVVRLGYSLIGKMNHPASPEAKGLEVDKLNRTAVKAYIENYLDQYKDAVGPLMGKRGLQYIITDSWEAGPQNWTDDMIDQFRQRRGYDMRPWMPVLVGRVVESAAASDAFLWDFRKTIGELTVECHYEQMGESLHARGMGRYTESHETRRALIADGMDVKKKADVPMSALWTSNPGRPDRSDGHSPDIRESASVSHIYGQNLVAAESLTAVGNTAWQWSPETLKPAADKELANGLNRFVIHTSVHQPVSDKIPGLGLGPYGQWFTRHETWAEQAKPWMTYLARSSYMLQQGTFVADVAYFYGEDTNITALFRDRRPSVPAGYDFDYVSADALLNRLSVKDGRIVTATGMSYRVLALDSNSQHMSLPVLRKIKELVEAGAVVVGPKPTDCPSLSGDRSQFWPIVNSVWTQGKIDENRTIAAALADTNVQPDFEYPNPESGTRLLFVHRRLADGELYWVNHRNDRAETVEATFRVQGKAPEFWYPESGEIAPAPYRIAEGRTIVPMRLHPNEAVFVVFRAAASSASREIPPPAEQTLAAVDGPWEVSFEPQRGAPAKITMDKLASWSDNADAGVKYFSGAGTYSKAVRAPEDWFKADRRIWLDLGDVKNLAEVTLNGKALGIVWKTPFRVDLTGALKPGENELRIKVVNLWVNRLIGDQQPDVTKKYTYTTQRFYRADAPLLPSGLLGPVKVVASVHAGKAVD